ncbi:MAG TPA: tungsten ABC transporter permease [Burkholderiaceae bacterium]
MSTPHICRVPQVLALLMALLTAAPAWPQAPAPSTPEVVRVVVVGGLVMSGFWARFARHIEAATGVQIALVASGPKEVIVPPFVDRKADLLFIHGSDEVMALLADGQAGRITAWGANEHVVIGPADDPAGVRQARDGADALQRIAAHQAPFVAFDDPGSHAIVQKLWRTIGARPPSGPWRLRDEAGRAQEVIAFAATRQAYVVAGHIPFAFGKMQGPGLAVLLHGDPAMRRPYVAVEQPGAAAWACRPEEASATRRVAAYVASPAGQQAVDQAGKDARGRWIFPLPAATPPTLPR